MQIEVISVEVKPEGKYRVANVAYKGPTGKVEGKKLVSFANKEVFKLLSESKQGDVFEVKSEKNDKGHWNWVEASPAGKNTSAGERTEVAKQASQTSRSTYETSEERAKRQVYIVRQSSITAALSLFELNKVKLATEADVINTAKIFEQYVFGIEPVVEQAEVQ